MHGHKYTRKRKNPKKLMIQNTVLVAYINKNPQKYIEDENTVQ